MENTPYLTKKAEDLDSDDDFTDNESNRTIISIDIDSDIERMKSDLDDHKIPERTAETDLNATLSGHVDPQKLTLPGISIGDGNEESDKVKISALMERLLCSQEKESSAPISSTANNTNQDIPTGPNGIKYRNARKKVKDARQMVRKIELKGINNASENELAAYNKSRNVLADKELLDFIEQSRTL